MSDNENKAYKEKSKNKFWNIFSTIIKSIILLLIIGFIMFVISLVGSAIYSKNSGEQYHIDGWSFHGYLNNFYGIIGIIIYVLNNYFGFLSYNSIINSFKNCKIAISKFLFIVFSVLINLIMLIVYSQVFTEFSSKNKLLEFFNNIIIKHGTITFPIIFLSIYIYKKKLNTKIDV